MLGEIASCQNKFRHQHRVDVSLHFNAHAVNGARPVARAQNVPRSNNNQIRVVRVIEKPSKSFVSCRFQSKYVPHPLRTMGVIVALSLAAHPHSRRCWRDTLALMHQAAVREAPALFVAWRSK